MEYPTKTKYVIFNNLSMQCKIKKFVLLFELKLIKVIYHVFPSLLSMFLTFRLGCLNRFLLNVSITVFRKFLVECVRKDTAILNVCVRFENNYENRYTLEMVSNHQCLSFGGRFYGSHVQKNEYDLVDFEKSQLRLLRAKGCNKKQLVDQFV